MLQLLFIEAIKVSLQKEEYFLRLLYIFSPCNFRQAFYLLKYHCQKSKYFYGNTVSGNFIIITDYN